MDGFQVNTLSSMDEKLADQWAGRRVFAIHHLRAIHEWQEDNMYRLTLCDVFQLAEVKAALRNQPAHDCRDSFSAHPNINGPWSPLVGRA